VLAQELMGPGAVAVAEVLVEQTFALNWLNDIPGAERAARQAVDIYGTLPKLHPDRVFALAALGEILRERRKFAEASSIFNEVLSAYRKIYGQNHHRTADALDSLARIALAQQRFVEAEELARQALESQIEAEGADHYRTGTLRTMLAMIQIESGEYADAEAQLRAAIVVFGKNFQADHPHTAAAEYHLGVTQLATHRPQDAEATFRAAIIRARRAGESEWRVARAASGLGDALYRQGRAGEAEPYLVNSYRTVMTSPSADVTTQAVVRDRIVRFYTERRHQDRLHDLMQTTQQASSAADSMRRADADP
jgi:tetratricopeptide (TPR) repeat protein